MKPELESIVDKLTAELGISAHSKGSLMEVDLNWDQLDSLFKAIHESMSVRYRSIMGVIEVEAWVAVCRALTVKRIAFVRETVFGVRDFDYPRVTISKATRIHGVLHTLFAQIGVFKSEDLGFRFIPKLPPKSWASMSHKDFSLHADVMEALRARGVVTSEGFPSEAAGTMAYLLFVELNPDETVVAHSPSKEATPNDGMMASVLFQTKNALALTFGYDFNAVAQPSYVLRRLIGTYMSGGIHDED